MLDQQTAASLIVDKVRALYELIEQMENIAEEAGLSFWSDFDYGVGRRVNNS